MRSKYRSRLDMNKTGGNAIRLKLTSLRTAFKNLDEKPGARFAAVETRAVESEVPSSDSWQFRLSDSDFQLY